MKKIVTLSLFFLTSVSVFAMEGGKHLIYSREEPIRASKPLSASQEVLVRALKEAEADRQLPVPVGLDSQKAAADLRGVYTNIAATMSLETPQAQLLSHVKEGIGLQGATQDEIRLYRNVAALSLKELTDRLKDLKTQEKQNADAVNKALLGQGDLEALLAQQDDLSAQLKKAKTNTNVYSAFTQFFQAALDAPQDVASPSRVKQDYPEEVRNMVRAIHEHVRNFVTTDTSQEEVLGLVKETGMTFTDTSQEELNNYIKAASQAGLEEKSAEGKRIYTALVSFVEQELRNFNASANQSIRQLTPDEQQLRNFNASANQSIRQLTPDEQQGMEAYHQQVKKIVFGLDAAASLIEKIGKSLSSFVQAVRNDTSGRPLSQVAQAHFQTKFEDKAEDKAEILIELEKIAPNLSSPNERDMILLSLYRTYAQVESQTSTPALLQNKELLDRDRRYLTDAIPIQLALLPILDAKILQLKEGQPVAKPVLSAQEEEVALKEKVAFFTHQLEFQEIVPQVEALTRKMSAVFEDASILILTSSPFTEYGGEAFAAPDNYPRTLAAMKVAIEDAGLLNEDLVTSLLPDVKDMLGGFSKEGQVESTWSDCFSGPKAGVVKQAFANRAQNPAAFEAIKKQYGYEEGVVVSLARDIAVKSKQLYVGEIQKAKDRNTILVLHLQVAFYEALIELLDENLKARFTGEVL